jgi:hypothetical protein
MVSLLFCLLGGKEMHVKLAMKVAVILIASLAGSTAAFAQNLQCGYDSQHNFRCYSNDQETGETCGYDSQHNYQCY